MTRQILSNHFIWNSLVGVTFLTCLTTTYLTNPRTSIQTPFGSSTKLLANNSNAWSCSWEYEIKSKAPSCRQAHSVYEATSSLNLDEPSKSDSLSNSRVKTLDSKQISYLHLNQCGRKT